MSLTTQVGTNVLDLKLSQKSTNVHLPPFNIDHPMPYGKAMATAIDRTGYSELLNKPGETHLRMKRTDYIRIVSQQTSTDKKTLEQCIGSRYTTPMHKTKRFPPRTTDPPADLTEQTPTVSTSATISRPDTEIKDVINDVLPESDINELIHFYHEMQSDTPVEIATTRSDHQALNNYSLGDAILKSREDKMFIFISKATGKPESNTCAYIRHAVDEAVRRTTRHVSYLVDNVPVGEIRLLFDALMSVSQKTLGEERSEYLNTYNKFLKTKDSNFLKWSTEFYHLVERLRGLGISFADEQCCLQLQILLKESDKRYTRCISEIRSAHPPLSYKETIAKLKIKAIELGDVPRQIKTQPNEVESAYRANGDNNKGGSAGKKGKKGRNPHPRPAPHSSGEDCKHFQKYGKCRFGDKCIHIHGNSKADNPHSAHRASDGNNQAPANPATKIPLNNNKHLKVCYSYANNGTCKYGDKCKFSHEHRVSDNARYVIELAEPVEATIYLNDKY